MKQVDASTFHLPFSPKWSSSEDKLIFVRWILRNGSQNLSQYVYIIN